jgi:hypothetical protein
MPPMPCWLGSRFADAAFIASTACSLSCAPDAFHGSLPVMFPMVSYERVSTCIAATHFQKAASSRTSAAPLTYWAWEETRPGLFGAADML